MKLLKSGNVVDSVFELLGLEEDDLTAALAYVLANSNEFLNLFTHDLYGVAKVDGTESISDTIVSIQTSRRDEGRTDIEIQTEEKFFTLVEAKRDVNLPESSQLALYAPIVERASAQNSSLLVVTNATQSSAESYLNNLLIEDIRIEHRTWRHLSNLASEARKNETHQNKRLLGAFVNYLRTLLGMEVRFSNMVYVVTLGQGGPPEWDISWRDIVQKYNRYFYPIGKGWPAPPNHLAFRYEGKLQSIHYIESYEILRNPRLVFQEAPDKEWEPHFCFSLGPAIVPQGEVRPGPRINRAARCWCMLDTLLTSETISEALTKTEERKGEL